jgi:hypothetical protein
MPFIQTHQSVWVILRPLRVFDMGRHIWREDGSVFYNIQYILLSQIWDSPNLEGQVPVLFPPGTEWPGLNLSLILRPTVSRPVCLGIKYPSGTYDQIFIIVKQLLVCWCVALSLTRGRVCRLQLLLALASADIFGSDSHGSRDHNLLSQIRDFPFRRLLRLTALRWGYSTPPPHGRGGPVIPLGLI